MPKKKQAEWDSSSRRIHVAKIGGITIRFVMIEGTKILRSEPPILRMS